MKLFSSLWTACVTPFNWSGSGIDYTSLYRLLIMQAKAKNGIVLLGSTGEVLSLTNHEKRALVKFVCNLKLNVEIIVGVPGVNLYQSLKWIDFCNSMPIHAYLITTPIYTKPGAIGQTLWFEKLLEIARVPAIFYNTPSRAGMSLHVETVVNLSNHEKFWAIKDSSGNIDSLIEYKKVAPNIEIFCGDDSMALDMSVHGASGLVSVISNIWPYIVHKYLLRCLLLVQHTTNIELKKNIPRLIKDTVSSKIKSSEYYWQKTCRALSVTSNPIPVKVFLHNLGLIKYKTVRLPLSTEDLFFTERIDKINSWIKRIK